MSAPPAHPLSGSFRRNMALPVHRWFRYSAGFSAAWAEGAIAARQAGRPLHVCDPFGGSGTALLSAQCVGAEARGVESHPFVARVARAKLHWNADPDAFLARAERVLRSATPAPLPDPLPDLLDRIFGREALAALLGLRAAIRSQQAGDAIDELLWLALVAILRACSPVGTAQWQYVLPRKTKASVADPRGAFRAQASLMADDMRLLRLAPGLGAAELRQADARETAGTEDGWADLVLTSPPYPNNYDYADATRIEMTFLGDVASWGDLQGAVRTHLVRSCSQHMAGYDASGPLADPALRPIAGELADAYARLDERRRVKRGRKAYHLMAVAYFHDLAACWHALRRAVREGGEALLVVGDSAPYGVHLPVERWLGELALAAGFESYGFTKLRDRNTSPLWKSRRHDVRLHEGILRVQG